MHLADEKGILKYQKFVEDYNGKYEFNDIYIKKTKRNEFLTVCLLQLRRSTRFSLIFIKIENGR